MVINETDLLEDQHVFDIPHVRAMLIVLYTVVFIFCFFGNLAVVLVVTFHSRMRNSTKFFLGNLAFANLCVGVFCIYQSLTSFLYESWFYGDFMCKMYHFTQSLCHCASILILIAIAIERYLVLLYPFKARQVMTIRRLAVIILLLWISSAAIASPRLYYFGTIKIPVRNKSDTICVPKKSLYDPATADTIYFVLLYVFPLAIITVLYLKIAQHLRRSVTLRREMSQVRSSRTGESDKNRLSSILQLSALMQKRLSSTSFSHSAASAETTGSAEKIIRKFLCRCLLSKPKSQFPQNHTEVTFMTASSLHRSSLLINPKRNVIKRRNSMNLSWSGQKTFINRSKSDPILSRSGGKGNENKDEFVPLPTIIMNAGKSTSVFKTGNNIRKRRRLGVRSRRIGKALTQARLDQRLCAVRVLIVIVVTFAVLNLPFHLRKLCLNYLPSYNPDSDINHLITPLTFMMMYANCAINPILYAFLNKRFRRSLFEFLSWRRPRCCTAIHV